MADHRRLVYTYYAYRATATVGFITPIFTLFLLFRDLTYTEIGTLSAILAVLVVVGEVPTGYVGDRLGRRDALLLGKASEVASLLVLVVAHSFPTFVLGYAWWSLALTMRSGTASAWLYDTLGETLGTESFTRVKGRGDAVASWATALAMVAGGALYVGHPTWPFLVTSVVAAASAVAVLRLPKNARFRGADDGGETDPNDERAADTGEDDDPTVREALALVRRAFARPPLRTYVPAVGLLFAGVVAANQYVQPVTVDVFDAVLADLGRAGLPPEAALGVLYAGFTVVASAASYHADTVERRLGPRRASLLVPVGVGAALVVPVAVPVLAVPVFVLLRAAAAALRPISEGYVNDRVTGAGRATVLSAASMVYALVRVPLALAAGVLADLFSPLVALAALGVVMGTGVLALGGLGRLAEPDAVSADGGRPDPTETERWCSDGRDDLR